MNICNFLFKNRQFQKQLSEYFMRLTYKGNESISNDFLDVTINKDIKKA